MADASDSLQIDPAFASRLPASGLTTTQSFFENSVVKVWRSLPDRENATVDLPAVAGHVPARLHVKRYNERSPVVAEVRGHQLTVAAGLPTANLVVHGALPDGRSVIAFADLAGYSPADKIIASAADFDQLLTPTVELAARLHNARLHHRDLYLCHFLVRSDPFDIRLIDTARVARMNNPFTCRRWIVKDLAQFWFSTTRLPVTDVLREQWLVSYARSTHQNVTSLRRSICTKAARIARHDRHLNASQPDRNISIPR